MEHSVISKRDEFGWLNRKEINQKLIDESRNRIKFGSQQQFSLLIEIISKFDQKHEKIHDQVYTLEETLKNIITEIDERFIKLEQPDTKISESDELISALDTKVVRLQEIIEKIAMNLIILL